MSMLRSDGLLPRMKPLSDKRSTIVSILDIGTSKVCCLIAELTPRDPGEAVLGRTHKIKVLGLGHQKSRGIKSGVIVNLDQAEQAIRHAVESAERNAGMTVDSLITNVSSGRLVSEAFSADISLGGHAVEDRDVSQVLLAGAQHALAPERSVVHSIPIGYSLDGDFVKRMRERFVSLTLQQIADSQGDVDSYISQQSEDTITNPLVAADIANRLLAVDRACEALKYLNAVTTNHAHTWQFTEWNNARIDTLETLGEKEELINFLWECFQRTLGSDYLRNLMKQLPDFEDFEYERRAFEWAASYTDIHQALYFFVDWQAYEQGAKLTVERHKDLNGDLYQSLSPAADALQGSYPLAATLIRRSMIDSSLNEGRSSRYKHAARHLLECQSANAILNDYGEFITHDDYVNQLKIKHGRKISFWSFLPDDFISKHLSP